MDYECFRCHKINKRTPTKSTWKMGPWRRVVYINELGTRTASNICGSCERSRRLEFFQKAKPLRLTHQTAWRKTIPGYVSCRYSGIRQRCLGQTPGGSKYYKGLTYPSRQEFHRWSVRDPAFLSLHKEWTKNNFPRALAPSIDRIDPDRGYTFDNIRWITQASNASRGRRTGRNQFSLRRSLKPQPS